MARKPAAVNKRLANRVMWGLEDIMAACISLRRALTVARQRAEALQDVLILGRLGDIGEQVAIIERRAVDARRGEYRQ